MAGRQAQAVVPAGLLDDIISKSKPLVQGALKAADAAAPVIDKAVAICRATYKKLEPYHPEDFLPLICGFVLIFYGGVFPVTIAAVEAFRICGWDRTRNSMALLYRQYKVALEASKKDDVVDANQDGVPDVQQIDTRALASRKIALFMRCTDPNAMHEGLQGVTAGCSAVVATLRVHFAQTLTLGVSLGDVFTRTADQVLRPALEKAVPLEYHKWIGMGISYACRSLAVTIAWWCTRIISALHSATRGAQLVLYGVTLLAARHHIQIPVDLSATNPLYPIVCGTVGGAGLYFQLARGFGLPFPFNLLLLPVRFVEWLLWYFLAYGN